MKKALIQLHIAIILLSATGILGKIIHLNEGWLVWYRLLITAVTLSIVNLFFNEIEATKWKQKFQMLFTGGLQGLHWLCFFASIKYANVSVALICLSCTSFFTSILQSVFNKSKPQMQELALSTLAIFGIGLIFYHDLSLKTGILFGILSALLLAFVPVLNKKQLASFNAPTVAIWTITGGFLLLSAILPVYIAYFPEGSAVPGWKDSGWLILLSWLCTIVTWRLTLNALKKVSAYTFNLLLNLEPVYGIVLAIIFLKEHHQFNTYFYIGLFCILVTVFLQTIFIFKEKKKISSATNKL